MRGWERRRERSHLEIIGRMILRSQQPARTDETLRDATGSAGIATLPLVWHLLDAFNGVVGVQSDAVLFYHHDLKDLPMSERRYSLDRFLEKTRDKDLNQGLFELESDRMLDINLSGEVWTKMGSMIAYTGNVKFEREGILSQGLGNLLKKAVSGEGTALTKVSGKGSVFCADSGKKITILELQNEAICVNGNDLLAFEMSLNYNIKMMKKMTAMLAGGLFNIRLEGTGMVAITSHYDPITLPVTPHQPVVTDPNATVLWSGQLEPQLKTDVQFKTMLGRGSGESLQFLFQGHGFVVVQPYEEVVFQNQS